MEKYFDALCYEGRDKNDVICSQFSWIKKKPLTLNFKHSTVYIYLEGKGGLLDSQFQNEQMNVILLEHHVLANILLPK